MVQKAMIGTAERHVGDGDREAEAAVHREHDALALVAKNRLANEVEDGSLSGQAKDAGMQEPRDGSGSPACLMDEASALNELTYPTAVRERIGEQGARDHQEDRRASDAGERVEDVRGGGSCEDTFVDAKKPEGRKVVDGRDVGGEQWLERVREHREDK
jgi:hypothetical protein